MPSLVTAVTAVVEFLPDEFESLIRPGFGTRNCFFDSRLSSFIFFHLHLLIMQLANVVFFVLTIREGNSVQSSGKSNS